MIIDIVCYVILLVMLLFMTRVQTCKKVALSINSVNLPGSILLCYNGVANRVGLLNTPQHNTGDGLLLKGVKSVHTKGMHYPIDLIFLDESMRILRQEKNVLPNQTRIRGPRGTRSTLELGAGSIDAYFQDLKPYTHVEVAFV